MDAGEQNIFNKLREKFGPTELRVQDISGRSILSARDVLLKRADELALGGCGSFYAISITSENFKGLSIVKQHRLVNETLKQEIEGIHGLQVRKISFRIYLQEC